MSEWLTPCNVLLAVRALASSAFFFICVIKSVMASRVVFASVLASRVVFASVLASRVAV